ncbi:MAG: class I SAM-dependent methyltransferase [Acidobacteria bacterium]|nr:class I SAM-dependent methyltransferase [Acidobacteriota bacterium]MBI3422777.1 class I SAM-dependent methyltransferase [Acidobacteriota bacterium]
MAMASLFAALDGVNFQGLRLALRDRERARVYLSRSVRLFDELSGRGLTGRDPLRFVYQQGWASRSPETRVVFPATLETGGGTQLNEQVYLATMAQVLRPRKVFEIGTYRGHTTSLFILNTPAETEVWTLDLPPQVALGDAELASYLDSDVTLVRQRALAHYVRELGLTERCQQVFGDSLQFDPAPHRGTVELGFIDGAHARRYVESDTRKMAVMMAERGLVFWHDYGGKGDFKPLTDYLDSLAREIEIFRVPETSLAWAAASEVRKLA